MRAVSNSGPRIHLSWIGQLDLLQQLFDDVCVPGGVQDELLRADADTLGLEELRAAFVAGRFDIRALKDVAAVATLTRSLGRGEVEVIALMHELQVDFLLLDDLRARKIAERQGLRAGAPSASAVPRVTVGLFRPRHHSLSNRAAMVFA